MLMRLLSILLLCSPIVLRAQGFSQLADFNTAPNEFLAGGMGSEAVFVDGRHVFVATDRVHGAELWVSDGSALNTRLLADICPGRCSSSPSSLFVIGTTLFFAANDGRLGIELWQLAAGSNTPSLVADINPGAESSNPARFARLTFAINGSSVTRNFFAATRRAEGREIWRLTTGATPTVSLELDVAPGPSSGEPRGFTILNTLQVTFTAQTPSVGRELYALNYSSTSAVPSGASVLTGLGTNAQNLVVTEPLTLASKTYVLIRNSSSDHELWATDGTPAGTLKLRTADSIGQMALNATLARLFFSSRNGSIETLAISDGTVAGTIDLSSSNLEPRALVALGTKVLFTANSGSNGRELFVSDGTAGGTGFLKQLVTGSTGIPSSALAKRSANNQRYLLGFGDQYWISDGTSAGTLEISGSAINGSGGNITQLLPTTGTSVIIGFDPGANSSGEPFFNTGTAASTVSLGNLISDIGDSFPNAQALINNRLIVSAAVENSDDSTFALPLAGGALQALGSFGGQSNGVHFGRQWFRTQGILQTDGSVAGTSTLTGFTPEIFGPECVLERNGFAYFLARAGNDFNDIEIWRSDGTQANTAPVTNLSVDSVRGVLDFCFRGFHGFAMVGTDIFAVGQTSPSVGFELLRLNAAEQVNLVADIRAGSTGSDIRDMVALDDRLLLVADDGIFGSELWVSNGNAQGTTRLTDLNPGAAGSDIFNMTRVGDRVFFVALAPASGRELYVSDGTVAGTARVVDLFAGSGSAFAGDALLVPAGNTLYFVATSSTAPNCRLFETDGSAAGTRCAYDDNVPLGPVLEAKLTSGGALVFTAARFAPNDGEEVRVLFNGQLLDFPGGDIAAGTRGSAPEALLAVGDRVFFRANDGVSGSELWQLALPNLNLLFANGFE